MCQDEFKCQPSPLPFRRQAVRIRTFGMALFLLFSSLYAQQADFVSFIADTHLDHAIICSPDGKNVYASGSYTIAVFQRRDGIDTIAVIQVLNNDHEGVHDVHNVSDLALSPDGRYLYGVCQNQQTLLLFTRDTTNGKIVLKQVIQDSVFGRRRGTVPFVERNHKLLISPDGRHLYWFYSGIGLVATFARNIESGEIEKVQVLRNGAPELGGLNVPAWIAISPDGKRFYGGGKNGTRMTIIGRNSVSGKIDYQDLYDIGPTPDGRWEYGTVTESPDGRQVYITNAATDALLVLSYDSKNERLMLLQKITQNSPDNLVVSSDGMHLYFLHYDNASYFALYQRDDSTGLLTAVNDHLLKIDYYTSDQPSRICMSPNGDAIYMIDGRSRHSIFKRDVSTGALSLAQQFKNNIGGTDRLRGSRSVEVSPDGRFLYVAARFEDAGISTFSRQQEDGILSLVGSDALASLNAMVMAPDGRHLYVSSFEKGTLTAFAIDPASGDLQLVQTRQDSLVLPTYLEWGGAMVFAPESSHLYLNDKMFLRVYHRNHQSGEISLVQKLDCRPYGLFEIVSMTLSPDGRNFYCNHVGNDLLQKIATFERNAQTGELSFQSKVTTNNVSGYAGMAIKVSPDGRHVYASTADFDADFDGEPAIAIFKRNSISGELSLLRSMLISGWTEIRDLEISSDGLEVYALVSGIGYSASLLAFFERDSVSGELTQQESFQSWRNGVYGMFDPADLTLSPDGRFLYVADLGGIATFATGRSNTTSVADPIAATSPTQFSLSQNYPNPFNPATTIRFELPHTGRVNLAVYNLRGELVRVLIEGERPAGSHRVEFDARGLASGIYFYRLESEGFSATRKLAVVR
ncbi:beta-propeller fold lactonase family protein [bacterium]|nr:beta-propeller fold lactonase family protein [bacterium]